MKVEVEHKKYTIQLLRQNPDKIYVFGDNLKRYGKGGQATIRDEPNVFGVATKRYPSLDSTAFFSDQQDELEQVLVDLRALYKIGRLFTIVFPSAGIGTGLSAMQVKSPLIWCKMNEVLMEHFGFINRNDN